MLCGKSLVSQTNVSFLKLRHFPQILTHFYERRKITYVMILLIYFVIFYFIFFSQQKQVTIIHIKRIFKKQRIILLSQNANDESLYV